MHRYPTALAHLHVIRDCLVHVQDEEARQYCAGLIERLEIYLIFKKLNKATMLETLTAFRGIDGAEASIRALEAMASEPDAE